MATQKEIDYTTKDRVFKFWSNEFEKNLKVYRNEIGEIQLTQMAEEAQEYFKVSSPNGDTDIEQSIFDWAWDYVTEILFLNE